MTVPVSPWTLLARAWDELFPLRPAREAMALRACPPEGAFLDAGCGSGSLVRALAARKRRAFGFDLDPEFVRIAKERSSASEAAYAISDLRSIGNVFAGESFACITCLGQTLPHLLEDDDYETFFGGAWKRLDPDGVLIVQIMNDAKAPVERTLPGLEGGGIRLERRRSQVSPTRARLDLRIESLEGAAAASVDHRVWQPEELAAFAARSGFATVATWADETGVPWQGVGSSWILVLRRQCLIGQETGIKCSTFCTF